MTTANLDTSTDERLLVREIQRCGDSLWGARLSDSSDGVYIGLRDSGPPSWSLFYRCIQYAKRAPSTSQGGILFLGFLLLVPIDTLQLPARLILLPLLQVVWLTERFLGKLLRRSFFCPICHHSMTDPYVYCRTCNRVQGKLYPQFGSLLYKTCPECARQDHKRKSTWKTLGNYIWTPPRPLVCRDSQTTKGCYRPQQLTSTAGKCATAHTVLAGPSIRTKHPVLAHFIRQAMSGSRKRVYVPAWRLSELELRLAKVCMSNGLYANTSSLERLGSQYTFARSFVMQSGRRVHTLHNLSQDWLASEERLFTNGVSWQAISGIIFVVDVEQLRLGINEDMMSHVEVYSRIIRVIEKDYSLLPGTKLPMKVAVVVPVTENDALSRSADVDGGFDSDQIASTIIEYGPEFYGLCCRTVASGNLRFFGGAIPATENAFSGRWVAGVVEWMT